VASEAYSCMEGQHPQVDRESRRVVFSIRKTLPLKRLGRSECDLFRDGKDVLFVKLSNKFSQVRFKFFHVRAGRSVLLQLIEKRVQIPASPDPVAIHIGPGIPFQFWVSTQKVD